MIALPCIILDIVNRNRRLRFVQRVYQILNKERSNKNTIDVYDIVVVVGKCVQLKEKCVEENIDTLAVDR